MIDEFTIRTRKLREDSKEKRTAVRLAEIEKHRAFDRRVKKLRRESE